MVLWLLSLSVSRLVPLWRKDIYPQSHLWLSRKGITRGFSLRFMEGVIRLTEVETFFQELWLTKGFVILLSLISTCVVMLVFREQVGPPITMSFMMRIILLLTAYSHWPTIFATPMLVAPVLCQWSHLPTMPTLPHSVLATMWKEKARTVAQPLAAVGRQ